MEPLQARIEGNEALLEKLMSAPSLNLAQGRGKHRWKGWRGTFPLLACSSAAKTRLYIGSHRPTARRPDAGPGRPLAAAAPAERRTARRPDPARAPRRLRGAG